MSTNTMINPQDKEAWLTPQRMALLGAAAGFLDPNGGTIAGFHGAMNGLQIGNQMKQLAAQQQMAAMKLQKQMEVQDYLKRLAASPKASDPVSMGNALINSGHQELMTLGANLLKSKTAKSFLKGLDQNGNPTYYTGYSTGEVSPTGVTPAEKLMQVNEGNQITARNPYNFAQTGSAVPIKMSQGEAARLSQQERQFGMSHGLAQQNAALAQQNSALARYKAMQPKFVDGAFVYPPNEQNPQGGMIKTDLFSAPKGSDAEKAKMSERVKTTLGDDTEQLIRQATGSMIGSGVDTVASAFGGTTKGAEANATLKLRAATLAGNMPRFEGPQSDADRKYYLEMAGDLANPSKTTIEKLMALKELRRIHNLADQNGGVINNATKNDFNDDSKWTNFR